MSTLNLFAYGTLMYPEVFEAVTDICKRSRPATLSGYSRRAVKGECYPGLLPQAGARVEGRLYTDLDLSIIQTLDLFEGEIYERRALPVSGEGVGRIEAEVYVVQDRWRDRVASTAWDERVFATSKFDGYLEGCGRFRAAINLRGN